MQRPPAYDEQIQPGEYLGMLGDGQLGRMFCQAAQSMGYKVIALGLEADGPAGQVAEQHLSADYLDQTVLEQMAATVRAVTTEFENVPAQSLKQLSFTTRTTPAASALAVVQDRIVEKSFISAQGVPVAPHAAIRSLEDLDAVGSELFPGILKAARFGYDGKGQAVVDSLDEARQAFKDLGEVECVLEAKLPLDYEISVILARNQQEELVVYPVGVNHHINGILSSTTVYPGLVPDALATKAQEYAKKLASGLNYFGVMCVEFFILDDSKLTAGQPSLVVNEIAPRPHNSGHYTINATTCSQFEQQVRVMAGMPLGDTALLRPTIMLNILGDSWFISNAETAQEPDWASVLSLAGVSLHLYGKTEARQGRKMGHVNIVNSDIDALYETAQKVSDILHLGAELAQR
ncbi:MAG: 5-(carboxyamino)imidazole ribonucleotide synthase [Alcaligenaceae bacterium]|nr:5-(carboxyamino)imidazole ribonucleotide synthase [Alcaligenaceae bacterium]